jgi:dTDP-glucose pyrophosphorylase
VTGWDKTLIPATTTIRDTLAIIDAGSLQIALVVDGTRRLLGTVTDGDVRRGILGGHELTEPVSAVMNAQPTVARLNDTRADILTLMTGKQLHQIPVVNDAGEVVGIESIDAMLRPGLRPNPVVIMAGGVGSRLRPLTDDCPKPLLKIGNKPILETILEAFLGEGFTRFHIAVNYRADMLERHFGDGSQWGATITYLREQAELGTAGALSLLPERPHDPLVVINGDLLTKVNFGHMLDFHRREQALATMGVRQFRPTIPYGVLTIADRRIAAIAEKPTLNFFVNAGIYVLEPAALDHLPPAGRRCDMTDLFATFIAKGQTTAAFPIREYWLDVGRPDDFERAKGEYAETFE